MVLDGYLDALRNYASKTYVPGLDEEMEPVYLADIFVEPYAERDSRGGVRSEQGAGRAEEQRKAPRPASDVVSNSRRLVILGEPGQGKSTLLRRTACELVAQDAPTPIFAELGRRQGRVDGESAHSWLMDRLPQPVGEELKKAPGAREELCRRIAEGQAHLLLDGFDEMNPEGRAQVADFLEVLARSGNSVTLSSRPHVYGSKRQMGFDECQLAELGPEQIKELSGKVLRALAEQYRLTEIEPARMKVAAAAAGTGSDLARNPLLLSFLCLNAVSRQHRGSLDTFPTRTTPLIGECLDVMAQWQAAKNGPWPREVGGLEVRRFLGPLALRTFDEGNGSIQQEWLNDEAERRFIVLLQTARFLRLEDNAYKFPLETFREYLAGWAAAQDDDPFSRVREHLHDPAWQRVVLYTAGSLKGGRAAKLDLLAPGLTMLLAKALALFSRAPAVLSTTPPEVQTAEKLGKFAAAEAERGIAKRIKASRQSTEFFLTAILRHCRGRPHDYPYENTLYRDSRLALRCLAEVATTHEGVVADAVDRVKRLPEPQQVVALRLGGVDSAVRGALLEVLKDETVAAGVRGSAARALASHAGIGAMDEQGLAQSMRVAGRLAGRHEWAWELLDVMVTAFEEEVRKKKRERARA